MATVTIETPNLSVTDDKPCARDRITLVHDSMALGEEKKIPLPDSKSILLLERE